ncbi:MAG: CoA pyrophosphatase, partial [Sphaerospermopsis sp. SIO1G2]|nr:CoA pyrophosphatase [Sphaerospermopsis sp. SIO1G2]
MTIMDTLIFQDTLREQIKQRLATFSPISHAERAKKHAAVAITLVELQTAPQVYNIPFQKEWIGETAVVLTKRAVTLKKHAGQWALPGGRIDAGETPEETALRELAEEVNLQLTADHILGRLDDYSTR